MNESEVPVSDYGRHRREAWMTKLREDAEAMTTVP